MSVNGESIYGTGASTFANLEWWRCTAKEGKLYLHVFDWPGERGLRVPGLKNRVKRAYLLAEAGKDLGTSRDNGDVVVRVPARRPDRNASVVVLEIDGEARVDNSRAFEVEAPGTVVMAASEAKLTEGVRLEQMEGWEYLGAWRGKEGSATWTVSAPPGGYHVEVEVACAPGSEGNQFVLTCGGRTIQGMAPPTREWRDFQWMYVGRVELGARGPHALSISPGPGLRGVLMNVKRVRLVPE